MKQEALLVVCHSCGEQYLDPRAITEEDAERRRHEGRPVGRLKCRRCGSYRVEVRRVT